MPAMTSFCRPVPVKSRYWTLRDDFTDTVGGGGVNNTTSTPSGHTRTAVDGNSKLSIGSGVASFATGGAAIGNPGLWYPVVARSAGTVLLFEVNLSNTTNNTANIGFDSNQSGAVVEAFRFLASGLIQVYYNSTSLPIQETYSGSTSYRCALIMRSTGLYFFIKGGVFTYWRLLFASAAGTGNFYPVIEAQGTTASAFTSSSIRIPSLKILPAPVAYDTFNRAGAIGSTETTGEDGQPATARAWTGATWTVADGKAVNTPTQGVVNVITNGTFDSDTTWTKGDGWSIGSGKATKAATIASNLSETALTVGRWYLTQYDLVVRAGGFRIQHGSGGDSVPTRTLSGTYYNSGRAISDTTFYVTATSGAGDGDIDNIVSRELDLSSLFLSITDASTYDVLVGADLVLTSGTQAGVVMCLDSTSNPLNFIIGYHNGTNAILDKCVNGTYTNLISVAATYSSGATLWVRKVGNAFELYYNGARVGTTGATVSDAGIISNTKHGLFSTYSANTLDKFRCIPTGALNEYGYLDSLILGD